MGFSPPSGGGGAVTSVFTRTGAVTATAGDYTAALVTNAADKSSATTQAFTGSVSANDIIAAGRIRSSRAGATGAFIGRHDGGIPPSLNPAAFAGDFTIDYTTPGIWMTSGGSLAGGVTLDWVNLLTLTPATILSTSQMFN